MSTRAEDRERKERDLKERRGILFDKRFQDATLAKLDLPIAEQLKIQKFLADPKNFLVFCGSPGIGKTYFASAIYEWAFWRFDSLRYHNEAQIFQRLRDCIAEDKGDYLKALQLLIDDDFVILDDIGSQGVNDWRAEVIFDAIDLRYNSMKPTIVTSNFSKHEFSIKYHPRLMSRLFASENVIIELNNSPDLRQKGM